MERSLLKELKKSTVEAYINRARETFMKRMFWNKFFSLKYTSQLTYESLSGASGAPVMADVIEYNASAPEKTRRTIAKAYGDIPKTAIMRKMDEKDFNDYLTAKALASDSNKAALLDLIFGDIDFCYTGVMARTEHLALQALSYGSISLTTSNNVGLITESTFNLGIPAANKTAVDTIWSTAGSATPLADIQEIVEDASDNGINLAYMVMDRATFNYMKATTEVKTAMQGFLNLVNANNIPTLEVLNSYLSANLLPQIILVNSSVRFENKEHTLSNVAPWKTGYVSFIPEMGVGNILHGPIAKENVESFKKKAITTKKDHIFIAKYSLENPFGEYTEGQANFIPVFNDVDSLFILKTNGTSWA